MKVLPTWLNFFGPFLSSLDLRERFNILVQLLAGNGVVQPTIYVYTSPLGNETVQFLTIDSLKGNNNRKRHTDEPASRTTP